MHQLRDFIRAALVARVAKRRPREFAGLEEGVIDRNMVKHALAQPTGALAIVARRWITGSVISGDRYARHQKGAVAGLCKECLVPDTLHHILWVCPRWSHYRTWDVLGLPPTVATQVSGIPVKDGGTDLKAYKAFVKGVPKLLHHYMQLSVTVEGHQTVVVRSSPPVEGDGGDAHPGVHVDSLYIRLRLCGKQKVPLAVICAEAPQPIRHVGEHVLYMHRGFHRMEACWRCKRRFHIGSDKTWRSWPCSDGFQVQAGAEGRPMGAKAKKAFKAFDPGHSQAHCPDGVLAACPLLKRRVENAPSHQVEVHSLQREGYGPAQWAAGGLCANTPRVLSNRGMRRRRILSKRPATVGEMQQEAGVQARMCGQHAVIRLQHKRFQCLRCKQIKAAVEQSRWNGPCVYRRE
eukprot:2841302-Amphidinium_carterae.1